MNNQSALILVVEDDPWIREAIVMALEDEGYNVRSVTNGWEALQALNEGAVPSLILLDLMMPIMTGWAFLDEIRTTTSHYRDIPVAVVSAAIDKRVLGTTQATLPKPPDLDALLAVAQRFCPKDASHA